MAIRFGKGSGKLPVGAAGSGRLERGSCLLRRRHGGGGRHYKGVLEGVSRAESVLGLVPSSGSSRKVLLLLP